MSASDWTELLLQRRATQAKLDQEKQLQQQQAVEKFTQSLQSGLSMAHGAMEKKKLDDIANSLMNEDIVPRAQATNPAIQRDVMRRYPKGTTIDGRPEATGGVEEMKLRASMADWRQRQVQDSIRQEAARAAAQASAQAASLRERQEARLSFDSSTEKLRNATKDSLAIFKNLKLLQKDLTKASTADEHNDILGNMYAIVNGANTAGIPVQMPQVGNFVPPETRASQSLAGGAMFGGGIGAMPGYTFTSATTSQVREGSRAVNPATGEQLIFRGGRWVPYK